MTSFSHAIRTRELSSCLCSFFCTSSTPIVKAKRLTNTDLKNLLVGNIFALRIPNYTKFEDAMRISRQLLQYTINDYTNAPGIGRIGTAYYEVENMNDKLKYYAEAKKNIDALREQCAPNLSPIDKLRLELDEIWPAGASIENLGHGKMFIGLARCMEEHKDVLPHEDVLRRDDKGSPRSRELIAQLALNIYLKVPKEGGELELWNKSCSDEEFNRLRGQSYGIPRHLLPLPACRIKPHVGELVLFHSTRLHAVLPGKGGQRLSLSCFLGYRGENQPLSLWS